MRIIQQELDQIRMEWNNHYIRAQRRYDDDGSIPGKPDMMFFQVQVQVREDVVRTTQHTSIICF